MLFMTRSSLCLTIFAISFLSHVAHSETKVRVSVLTPQQAALIQKAGFQEKLMVKIIQHHTPLVQTYIQHMRSDRELGSIPVLDEYILGRVDFEKTFNETSYDKHSSK